MKYTTTEEMISAQAVRARNALLAAPDYRCELVPGAGANLVRVIKPNGEKEYVAPGACSCRDHEKSLAGTPIKCKHRLLVDAFLSSGKVLPLPEPPVDVERARRMVDDPAREERMAATRTRRDVDFPDGGN